jgi:serine/threonine protein kinase
MEYVDGASLEDIIADKGKMNTPESIPIIRQITCAVDYAHLNNIIHRDLRPANILIEKSSKVRVADFGISKLLENTPFAKTVIGTPPYMSPEHFDGKAVFASDIYSIGVIFYEMLTGNLPYYDPNPGILKKKLLEESFTPPRVLNVSVPQKINDIILKCLEKEVSRRYQRGGDLMMDLDSCMIGSELQKEVADIRKRISIKEEPKAKVCWNCKRALPPRVLNCPRCGEIQ